jgi:hypothetical protein
LKTIWKFPLTIAERQTISIPVTSHFLNIGIDGEGTRCLWFAVDPTSDPIDMEIIKVGTGWDLPHVGDFIGTIIQDGFVWHYFCGPANSVNKTTGFHYLTRENDG